MSEIHGHCSRAYRTPTYFSWNKMRDRCNNPNNTRYARYGGRGISVCLEWDSFEKFLEDMGTRPVGMTLDRKDNDGNYCKDNCRWATTSEQEFNKGLTKANTSGIKGVIWDKKASRWVARYKTNGITHTLYRGQNLFEAACARSSWEWKNGVRHV